VHAKTLLVVRQEPDGLRRYCQVGTGNYNSLTAALYEDLGLLTCDPTTGNDLTQLFNELTGYGRNVTYDSLLVAPHTLRQGIVDLIRAEVVAAHRGDGSGSPGRIIMKMNALVDAGMIDELYAASCAGGEIDLIVRGICCLVPGVPGQSENIRVRSLVGRYLEHSRIFYFANGNGEGAPRYLIGSADLMPRNLDRRVEAMVDVADPGLRQRLHEILDIALADDVLAWELDADGTWHRLHPTSGSSGRDSHRRLQELAGSRARRG
jgi:polyphosphate kinase